MAQGELLLRSGQQPGRVLEFNRELLIGREAGDPSLAEDPLLSRRHARIFRDGQGQLVVEDLGSANGTFVNGQRISGMRALQPGDRLRLGGTEIEVRGQPAPTVATPVAPAQQAQYGQQPPAAYPPSPYPPPGPPLPPGPPPGAPAWQPAARPGHGGRTALIVALVLLLIAGLGVGGFFAFSSSDKKKSAASTSPSTNASPSTSTVNAPNDCGANLGGGQKVAMVAYVESNSKTANSVLAIPYRSGDMTPLAMSQCSTGGLGSADLTDSGVLDANNQITINPAHTMLFAVNQGSDTIAVYRIQPNGGLQAVAGSPFPSGGKGPTSLGLSGDTLVVTNKAQDGVRDLSKEQPVYTSFHVGSDGRLAPVAGSSVTADPGSSPTDAYVPKEGGVVFSTEESGPLRSFSIDSDGKLVQAPGSPKDLPSSAYPEGFDPAKKFALGIVGNPNRKLLYISLSTIPALAVYSYNSAGKLTFVHAVLNSGSYLPCWNVITPDGHFLFTSNADTNNVTVFDLDDPTHPLQIQTFPFKTPGNPWNAAVDPSGTFLLVNTPRDTFKVPVGEGNTLHLLRIGSEGKLTEVGDPAKFPVPVGVNPQGLAVINLNQ